MMCGRLLDLVQPEVDLHDPPTPSTKYVDRALLAILKLSHLEAAILFLASRPYGLGTVGYLPFRSLAPMFYASTVM